MKANIEKKGKTPAWSAGIPLILTICALIWATPKPADAATIFVKASATGSATGASWANACTSLQDGLAAAASGDEIWIAAGVYKPDQGKSITPGDRNATFTMKPNVGMYGGFSGNETSLTQRNWNKYKTILSGDLKGDDMPRFSNREDNCFHVVFFTGNNIALTATLDGVTVTGGFANVDTFPSYIGGGFYLFSTSPVIRNCIITENYAAFGGGGRSYIGNSRFENCIIKNNAATMEGGGLLLDAKATLIGCTVINNSSEDGGGLLLVKATTESVSGMQIMSSILWGNTATNGPQVAALYGTFSFLANDIQGGPEAIYSSADATITYTANINKDPLLSADGRLQAGSPCIGAADPATTLTTDIDGEARPSGLGFDIGADEFVDTDNDTLPDLWEMTWFGNLQQNGDGDADSDWLTNAEEYLASTNPVNSDTDGDGYTDLA